MAVTTSPKMSCPLPCTAWPWAESYFVFFTVWQWFPNYGPRTPKRYVKCSTQFTSKGKKGHCSRHFACEWCIKAKGRIRALVF
jgi:hypothetical protein